MGQQDRHDRRRDPERAAQYVRMSTEHQKYSTVNQAKAIAEYAAAHSLTIVRTYADERKSGLIFEGRHALQRLMSDIVTGAADFSTILVYDVSRWGRFQDTDEGAYYEFICKKAGVRICYCAESFENDASLTASVLKSMKRAMAAEYSRELSKKTFHGQSTIVRLGYRAGATAPYGLRRLLIDSKGAPIKQLERGQYKALATDRIILVHGPAAEVEIVRTIFHRHVHEGKSPGEIATMLNADAVPYQLGKPWSYGAVRRTLTNEVYIGNNVYNRQSAKLKSRKKISNPPNEWVRGTNSIKPIVSRDLFESANRLIDETRLRSNADLLDRLRKLLEQKGHLSERLITDTDGMYGPGAYRSRFGSLGKLYRMIGYESPGGLIGERGAASRALLKPIIAQVAARAAEGGAKSVRTDDTRHFLVVVNDRINISVAVGRCFRHPLCCEPSWRAHVGRVSANLDYAIVARLDEANQSIADYYFLPQSELKRPGGFWILTKTNRTNMESHRHKSLDFVAEFVAHGCIMTDEFETDRAVSDRCKRLRLAMDYNQSSTFAKFLGVSPQRWNNVEAGLPLGKDLALTLTRKIPVLTLDWLYMGRSEGLTPDLASRLEASSTSNAPPASRPRRPS